MSRLRNRIRKADYFTDGELLRWHRDKRTTYSGLWALAEDSGCLEDDPFAWKLALWGSPLDSDITVELLTQWRDELVEAEKLLPYEADGKHYLYIRTFHQHERPRNPQKNDLPLHPQISCHSVEGIGKDGRKWVRTQFTDTKLSVQGLNETSTKPVGAEPELSTGEKIARSSKISPQSASDPVDNLAEFVPESLNGTCTGSVHDAQPCPEYLKVHKGQGHTRDRGDVSPIPLTGAKGNGNDPPICWRCRGPISNDDVLDDKCVVSRRGIRHKECSP